MRRELEESHGDRADVFRHGHPRLDHSMGPYYDVIVVGAGSAGSAVAVRLSESPSIDVLLLEAGPEAAGIESVSSPPLWPTNFGSEVDWGFQTEAQEGTEGRPHLCVRGKIMGGSSAVIAMVFVRGDRVIYDSWADNGADGWDYDALPPYFKRQETYPGGDPSLRGTCGPLQRAPSPTPNPVSLAFVEACAETGF